MGDKIILCRRDFGAIGTVDYHSKPIKTPNGLNWCDDCLKRLPLWPSNEITQEVQNDVR